MRKYLVACNNDTRRAMTLYRHNLTLSQQMFTMISCFEVALRNKIDKEMKQHWGNDWLRDFVMPGGAFASDGRAAGTKKIIKKAYDDLMNNNDYSHSKLLSQMEFGVWKYMFSPIQFRLTGSRLLHIFPNKARSTPQIQYNHSYVYNELDKINTLRNRIAHHEPVCFALQQPVIDTAYILNEYQKIQTLFMWMGIDSRALLYGLDHIQQVCMRINELK